MKFRKFQDLDERHCIQIGILNQFLPETVL
jgi:hypothetical protein